MSVILTDTKKKVGGPVGKAQSWIEPVIAKPKSPAVKLDPVRRHSEILTAQWRARRKAIVLNPKGRPRISLASLIEESRK
jgi:hypothetical protein